MESEIKKSLLNNLIGTPEVTIKIDTRSIIIAAGALVISAALIFLIQYAVKKI